MCRAYQTSANDYKTVSTLILSETKDVWRGYPGLAWLLFKGKTGPLRVVLAKRNEQQ